MDYDNNLTGIISRNENKADEKHPDIKGQCEIDGVQYWVDGWARTRKSDGGKFYSLKFKPKESKPSKPVSKPVKVAQDDEDIPF